MRLTALLSALTLMSALLIIIPLAVGSDQSEIIESLENLSEVVESELPKDAFANPNSAEGQRGALLNKIGAMIHKIKAGAYNGALNKLKNDISNTIIQWIADEEWETILLEMVDEIIKLIEGIIGIDQQPPTIVELLRYPETPNYDEPVTVIAHVIDEQSGVESVILSYSTEPTTWVNITMNLSDELYVAEIPPQPYNTTVSYKIYAYDWASNLASSETYSYTVIDSHSPVISYVDRIPASPNYNETVTVFANVTEPPEASGIKNVTLYYRMDSEWQPVEMTLNQLYTGMIPAFPYGTVVQYSVHAFDYAENLAASSVYSYTVGAPPNLPPVAIFTESAETVSIGVLIHFNASGSYDPDGYIVSYFWDFGDDTNATGVIVDHAYASSGNYTVTLKVTDNYGAVDFASSTKTVLPNQPPVALFTESATTVFTDEVIEFNASASYDLDGTIVGYSWDFGDGNVAIDVSVVHSYADDGAYDVILTVVDDDGATDIAVSTKYVLNRPPVASFTESAETVYTDEVVTVNATSSYDSDGVISGYFWDFGDGANATDAVIVGHAYVDDGVYIVTLTVIDDDGLTATVASAKTVLNRPPVASFTEDATKVLTGEVIRFDASGSEDSDGSIISYLWDFGDETTAVGVEVTHAYEDDGVYTVILRIIDDDGAIASASSVKTVSNRPPVAFFVENATVVKKSGVIRFDASGSYDLDGYIVSYFWDFGDGTNATDVVVNHVFVEAGNFTVTLTVTDDDGASSSVDAAKVVEKEVVGWLLAFLAAIVLGIAALTATLLYGLYRRRRKRSGGSGSGSSPVVTLYVPMKILAGCN